MVVPAQDVADAGKEGGAEDGGTLLSGRELEVDGAVVGQEQALFRSPAFDRDSHGVDDALDIDFPQIVAAFHHRRADFQPGWLAVLPDWDRRRGFAAVLQLADA